MNTARFQLSLALGLAIGALLGTGCAPRMTVATGTTIGLHANPGDLNSQPPQVTFGYKRAELALVPTAAKAATQGKCGQPAADAYSSIAIVDFQTKFFGETKLDQFIATGLASRDIQQGDSEFTRALAQGLDVRGELVEFDVYRALKAMTGDDQAARCIGEMDAMGALVPDKYNYIDIDVNGKLVARSGTRPASPKYSAFYNYRNQIKGSIAVLKSGTTIQVVQPDSTVRTLANDDLKRELAQYKAALGTLQQRAADQDGARNALAYYIKTQSR